MFSLKPYQILHIKPSQTLHIITNEANIRTMPENSSYTTIIPQYTEGNHYNAVNGELLFFGNAICFYFQSDSSFVTK